MRNKNEILEIEEDLESDDEISSSFDFDIATYPSDLTLQIYHQKYKEGEFIIPDFQRGFVWTIKQASLLIDSFLSGLPVPPVFLYINETNKSVVIDGQQRIMTIVQFLTGFFGSESKSGKRKVFRLTGLSENRNYHNKSFQDLDDSLKRKLKNTVLRAINIRQLNPPGENTCVYHIFERLNTGGTPLKPQEIRNCVFRGKFNEQLKTFNKDSNWRAILGTVNLDKNQKDVELLLRIFALSNSIDEYEKPMKEFLNKAMQSNQEGNTDKSKSFFQIFPMVTEAIVLHLGDKPFHLKRRLNVSTMDAVMVVLVDNFKQVDFDKLKQNYNALIENQSFLETIKTNPTDSKTVSKRVEIVESFLVERADVL